MKGTGGIVSQIINNLSKLANGETITRQGLTERIQKSERLKEAYEAEQDHIGDIVETGFFRALQDQKKWAMKEWFRYKGYTRGYVQKQEISNPDGLFSKDALKIEIVSNENKTKRKTKDSS